MYYINYYFSNFFNFNYKIKKAFQYILALISEYPFLILLAFFYLKIYLFSQIKTLY